MRGGQSSPRAQSSNGCHSPVLNLSKSGNDGQGSGGAPSERSDVHSPNPSIRDDDDNISDGNVSEVDDEHNDNDKDDDGSYKYISLSGSSGSWLIIINLGLNSNRFWHFFRFDFSLFISLLLLSVCAVHMLPAGFFFHPHAEDFISLSVSLSFMCSQYKYTFCVRCVPLGNHLTAKTKLTRIFNRSNAHRYLKFFFPLSLLLLIAFLGFDFLRAWRSFEFLGISRSIGTLREFRLRKLIYFYCMWHDPVARNQQEREREGNIRINKISAVERSSPL
jgi:hypothetical protein